MAIDSRKQLSEPLFNCRNSYKQYIKSTLHRPPTSYQENAPLIWKHLGNTTLAHRDIWSMSHNNASHRSGGWTQLTRSLTLCLPNDLVLSKFTTHIQRGTMNRIKHNPPLSHPPFPHNTTCFLTQHKYSNIAYLFFLVWQHQKDMTLNHKKIRPNGGMMSLKYSKRKSSHSS